VTDDRINDRLPVASVHAVAGVLEHDQRCVGDLFGERLAVCEREHRVGGAVDDQCGNGDRGETRMGPVVVRDDIVVLQ
jgi:hypothetical protein